MPELKLASLVDQADETSRAEIEKPLKDRAGALPNPHRDEIQEIMRERTQLNFSNVPLAIKGMFKARADEMGFKWPVHYLYYLMRKDGLDVPDPEKFDGRSK